MLNLETDTPEQVTRSRVQGLKLSIRHQPHLVGQRLKDQWSPAATADHHISRQQAFLSTDYGMGFEVLNTGGTLAQGILEMGCLKLKN